MPVKSVNISGTTPPLVSFIITTYGLSNEIIQECVEHILSLSLNSKEREIILIDNGSGEFPSKKLIDGKEDITYIRKKNLPLSQARNIGIQLATGDYIQFALILSDFIIRIWSSSRKRITKNRVPPLR